VVSVYYVTVATSNAYTVQITTAAGTGVTLNQNDRAILYCDGMNVVSAQTASAPASQTAIANDTTTNATMYPTWVTAATGNLPTYVSSTKLSFNPSTGVMGLNGYSVTLAGGLTLAGALTTSGAFATQFTMTGAYTYTFPSATSTLLAINGSGAALTFTTGTLSLAGNLATTGAYNVSFTMPGAYTYTFPDLTGALLGYLGMPVNSQNAPYSTVLTDNGKCVYMNSAGAFTINGALAYPVGAMITFYNPSAACTIVSGTDTIRLSPSGVTSVKNLAQYGVATAVKVASGNWIISGSGITT
jgi:hypothetical protein